MALAASFDVLLTRNLFYNKKYLTELLAGMISIEISDSTLDVLKAINLAKDEEAGAVTTFVGCIRKHEKTGDSMQILKSIEYEAYEEMATKKMKEICSQVLLIPGIKKICISHRVGIVPVGEVAIVVAVSSAHRKEGISAVDTIVDQVKLVVPIWKHLHFA